MKVVEAQEAAEASSRADAPRAGEQGGHPGGAPLDRPDVDRLWIEAARRIGFRVERTQDAYASTDGQGTILIGARETLDADDSLAQLVMHELCHALVQGETRWGLVDWGLDNTSARDDVREEACLRLQAHLAAAHGLRTLMAPTTPWRPFYFALPGDPLDVREAREAAACALARSAAALAKRSGVAAALAEALAGSAAILRASGVGPCAPERHPLGGALGPAGESCGSCAWRYLGGRGRPVDRCRQFSADSGEGRRVSAAWPSCERWEGALDCQSCGACCREAYHVVSVSMRDPVVWKRPELVVRSGHRFSILRSHDRCAALEVTGAEGHRRYACSIYEDRPQTCRDFARGGAHCLVARRRVGLGAG
jgi:hypothetical protein